jgi:hypothetical protein
MKKHVENVIKVEASKRHHGNCRKTDESIESNFLREK